MSHPADGVTAGFPRPGEVILHAYGAWDSAAFVRLIGDACRIVERDTGLPAKGHLTLLPGSILRVRVTGDADRLPIGTVDHGGQR